MKTTANPERCSVASGSAKVWLVREAVATAKRPERTTIQDCFVLATSASEAVEITGETHLRKIVRVEEVCPITQMPGDKYRVHLLPPNTKVTQMHSEDRASNPPSA